MSIIETAKKLKVNFYKLFVRQEISGDFLMPSLSQLITALILPEIPSFLTSCYKNTVNSIMWGYKKRYKQLIVNNMASIIA